MVDPDDLAAALLGVERDLDWNQPDLLFAIDGPIDAPRLRYLLQLSGDPAERLYDLLAIGVRIRDDVLGLAVAAGVSFSAAWGWMHGRSATKPIHALVAVLRGGLTAVVAREEGESAKMVDRLPESLGDHSSITMLATRLLAGDEVPQQRDQWSGARALIA